MRILLDANLFYRTLEKINEVYLGARYVSRIDLPHPSNDPEIWQWARDNGFAIIVSNDKDFKELVEKNGPPPKLIFLRLGNVSSKVVTKILLDKHDRIQAFLANPEKDVMEVIDLH